jgi:hypothetical protein
MPKIMQARLESQPPHLSHRAFLSVPEDIEVTRFLKEDAEG